MAKFFRTLFQSFYSKELYQDAAYKWRGTGIGLLAWLSLFGILFFIISLTLIPMEGYEKFKQNFLSQLPQITIQNGELSIDAQTPYFITFEGDEHIAVIDTSPETNALSLDQTLQIMHDRKIVVLATKNKVVARKSDGEVRIYDLSENKSAEKLTFTRTDVADIIETVEYLVLPFLAIFGFGFLLIYKIVQMLLYTIVTVIIGNIMNVKLDYSAIQRITTCAMFPAAILYLVFAFTLGYFPLIVSLASTIIFIIFGLKAAKIAGGEPQ